LKDALYLEEEEEEEEEGRSTRQYSWKSHLLCRSGHCHALDKLKGLHCDVSFLWRIKTPNKEKK
jgi:hypothetical protein